MTLIRRGQCCVATLVAVSALFAAAPSQASRPSMNECFEGSDFIANAARSRDAGMSADAFLGRMEQDFAAIHAYPSQLRWFVHDPDDEAFLLGAAREVYDWPATPETHRANFLKACLDRITEAVEPEKPGPHARRAASASG